VWQMPTELEHRFDIGLNMTCLRGFGKLVCHEQQCLPAWGMCRYGPPNSTELPQYGAKTIAVRDGNVVMAGLAKVTNWLRAPC
jgi:hypothetical protein